MTQIASSSTRRVVFLTLTVVGLIATWYHLVPYVIEQGGFSFGQFVADINANKAASAVTNDIMVVVVMFLFWSFLEARRLGMKHWWLYVLLTFTIALAVSFPLFMYMRERGLERLARTSG
jgi:hypothetical protein